MVNRDRHFDDSGWDEDHYLPRRQSGQSTCDIAAPLGEENFRLRPTLVNLAQTNIDLDQTLDELDAMGKAYLQLALENAMLKQQQGGPDVEAPSIPTESPQGIEECLPLSSCAYWINETQEEGILGSQAGEHVYC